jgi:hypothetical protein
VFSAHSRPPSKQIRKSRANLHGNPCRVDLLYGNPHREIFRHPLQNPYLSNPGIPCVLAWKAQSRLCSRFRAFAARGKKTTVICTAIARELAGFMWAVATAAQPTEPAAQPIRRQTAVIDRAHRGWGHGRGIPDGRYVADLFDARCKN